MSPTSDGERIHDNANVIKNHVENAQYPRSPWPSRHSSERRGFRSQQHQVKKDQNKKDQNKNEHRQVMIYDHGRSALLQPKTETRPSVVAPRDARPKPKRIKNKNCPQSWIGGLLLVVALLVLAISSALWGIYRSSQTILTSSLLSETLYPTTAGATAERKRRPLNRPQQGQGQGLSHSAIVSGKSNNYNHNYTTLPLEFVHIPKTGGTSIEAIMATTRHQHWGYCKWMNYEESLVKSKGMIACPPALPPPFQGLRQYQLAVGRSLSKSSSRTKFQKYDQWSQKAMPWHLPPWKFDQIENDRLHPYYYYQQQHHHHHDPKQQRPGVGGAHDHPAVLFAVVRNPYDRIVSEYYFTHWFVKQKQLTLQQMLLSLSLSLSSSDNNGTATGVIEPTTTTTATTKTDDSFVASPRHLNTWIQHQLRRRFVFRSSTDPWSVGGFAAACCSGSNPPQQQQQKENYWYGSNGGHWIPQFEYVYDPRPMYEPTKTTTAAIQPKDLPRLVHHVLKYERLAEDFDKLMQAYNLSSLTPLPHVMTTASSMATSMATASATRTAKLTRHNLTDITKQMIELIYEHDFELLEYPRESSSATGESITGSRIGNQQNRSSLPDVWESIMATLSTESF